MPADSRALLSASTVDGCAAMLPGFDSRRLILSWNNLRRRPNKEVGSVKIAYIKKVAGAFGIKIRKMQCYGIQAECWQRGSARLNSALRQSHYRQIAACHQ